VPRDQVFISYSHNDKKWREELEKHLKPYLRNRTITSWSDQQIRAGSQWEAEIESALTNSGIAVLLVTPDFLNSDFIHEKELGPLLKRPDQGGVKILWMPIRSSAYKQTPLKNYQAIIDPAKPLAEMPRAKRDRAWVEICEKIKEIKKTARPQKVKTTAAQMSPLPRHDLAVISKAALTVPGLLEEVRQQPWGSILQHVKGSELISKIFSSNLEPGQPSSIAAFFASLPKSEASLLSLILANPELNEQMGHLFWKKLVFAELRRRKRQIESIIRIADHDSAARRQGIQELKEVLDLESRFATFEPNTAR